MPHTAIAGARPPRAPGLATALRTTLHDINTDDGAPSDDMTALRERGPKTRAATSADCRHGFTAARRAGVTVLPPQRGELGAPRRRPTRGTISR